MLPDCCHSGRGGIWVGGALEEDAVEVGPSVPAGLPGTGNSCAGFTLWVGIGDVALPEDSRLGFFLRAVGSLLLDTTFATGLLLVGPSVEEESTCSAVPSLFTRTGIAWPSGVIACFLVLTVGVPLDCETSRVAGESSNGGGECPVWVGVDVAGGTVTVSQRAVLEDYG